jgi:hypothetical protein
LNHSDDFVGEFPAQDTSEDVRHELRPRDPGPGRVIAAAPDALIKASGKKIEKTSGTKAGKHVKGR